MVPVPRSLSTWLCPGTIAFVQYTLNFSARYFFIELVNGLPWGFYISVFYFLFSLKKRVGRGDAKCKYLTLTLGTPVFSIISLFFNILEIFLIKIFKFSFPSFLLKPPGECWQHFLFIPTLYHRIPDQYRLIECLKCDWCN